MSRDRLFKALICAAACLPSTAALAQPGSSHTTTGTAQAEFVAVGNLTRIEDLRFGRFMRPATASTITISPTGTVTSTGAVTPLMTVPQPASGRGPARFLLDGVANRLFVTFIPNSVNITNGTTTMTVTNTTRNTGGAIGFLEPGGQFDFYMGGRLNIPANPTPGIYSGNFTITVFFL